MISIVIPVYNRPHELRRALESCISQTGPEFEVVVVDDASTDNSAAVAQEYSDREVRVIRQPANRGSSPARNRGTREARGEWVVRMDSDDELLPGALKIVERSIRELPPKVGRIGLMYRYDDGRTSPFPTPTGETLDYAGFARWLETSELWDSLTVYRRTAWLEEPLPAGRLMELLHHFNFARKFDTVWLPEFGLLYHTDATERQSRDLPNPEECRQHAAEALAIIEQHGDILRQHAPEFLQAQYRRAAVFLGLSGERGRALRMAVQRVASHPLTPLNWAGLASVAGGERVLASALRWKWWLVEERRKRMFRP
jgi:hypothetical protein